MRIRSHLLLSLLLLVTALSGHAEAPCDSPEQLRFAIWMPEPLPSHNDHNKPFVDYLNRAVGKPVEVVAVPSLDALVSQTSREQIDIGFIGSQAFIISHDKNPNILPFATFARADNADVMQHYHSELIVLREGKHNSLESLKGNMVAMVSPGSVSGYVAPKILFGKKIGEPIESYFSRIIFSGQHHLSIIAVAKGRVAGAFIASTARPLISGELGYEGSKFKVLWSSPPIPQSPFVYRASLCEQDRKQIEQAMFALHRDPASREWLELFQASAIIPVSDSDYDVVRELYDSP